MDENKKNDGLPEIAQSLKGKKAALMIMIGVFAAGMLGIYLHHSKSTPAEEEKPLEETYSVQPTNPVPNKTETQKEVEQPKPKIITAEQVAFLKEKQKELQQRLFAPMMVVNGSAIGKQAEPATEASKSQDPNMQFMNQLSSQNTVAANAESLGPLDTIVAEGSLIHATLESATNSDLPGFLRAIVSEPVYAEDGSQILIPAGSRLIGQYKSGILQGQSRIFIVWTRVITPIGISVNLGSAGVDNLGVAGIGADEINRHFWERFDTASLLSIIGAGASNLGVSGADPQNSAASYREALSASFSQSANQSLQQDSMIAPTLKTYQGKPILVFVARDLHFAGLTKLGKQNINVF